ncbi:hypothetical protein Tco_0140780 [Tanacetum coccineum]
MHVAVVSELFMKKQNTSGEWAVAKNIKIGALKKTNVDNRKRASSRYFLYADTEDENIGLNLALHLNHTTDLFQFTALKRHESDVSFYSDGSLQLKGIDKPLMLDEALFKQRRDEKGNYHNIPRLFPIQKDLTRMDAALDHIFGSYGFSKPLIKKTNNDLLKAEHLEGNSLRDYSLSDL